MNKKKNKILIVKSLNFDKSYKQKEINKIIKQIKKRKIKNLIKKFFVG